MPGMIYYIVSHNTLCCHEATVLVASVNNFVISPFIMITLDSLAQFHATHMCMQCLGLQLAWPQWC